MDQAKSETPKAKTWMEFAGDVAKNPWVEGVAGVAALGAVIASRGRLLSAAEKYLPKAFSITGEAGENAPSVSKKLSGMGPRTTSDGSRVLEPSDILMPSDGVLRGAIGPKGPHLALIPDLAAARAAGGEMASSNLSGAGLTGAKALERSEEKAKAVAAMLTDESAVIPESGKVSLPPFRRLPAHELAYRQLVGSEEEAARGAAARVADAARKQVHTLAGTWRDESGKLKFYETKE